MSEDHDTKVKRLTMRSWRRGMREVDLILGPFAEARLSSMSKAEIDAFEALLDENDQALFAWISGVEEVPPAHAVMVKWIIETISSGRAV